MIGVVYQKNKQLAEAKAEYEDYLRRYPTGDGAESVRQRLAGDRDRTDRRARKSCARPSKAEGSGEQGPGQTTWSVSGSASQFYIRDDSFRVVRDPSLPRCLIPTKRITASIAMRCCRASICSARGVTTSTNRRFRFSGTEEHRFDADDKDIFGVSALYYETMIRDWGTFGAHRPPDAQYGRRARPLRRRPHELAGDALDALERRRRLAGCQPQG